MDGVWLGESLVSWREVLRLLLLSAVFTLAAGYAFPRNAPSRRALLLAAACALVFLPWVAAAVLEVWVVPVEEQPGVTLAESVPSDLLILWLSIAGLLLAWQIIATYREVRRIRALQSISDETLQKQVNSLAGALDIPPPHLRTGSQACASTFLQSNLILPAQWSEWDHNTLRGVLAHEMVHIQRRDDRWLLLSRALVLVYWWMPWLRYFYRTHIQAMEESCDDAASELVGHKLNYVGALAHAAGTGAANPGPVPHTVPGMAQHHLVGRIGRFGAPRFVELDTGSVYWSVLAILVLVLGLTAIEPRQTEPSFAAHGPADLSVPLSPARVADNPLVTFPVVTDRVSFPGPTDAITRERAVAPIYSPPVIYPGSAIRSRQEADITVEFLISKDGSVTQAEVVSGETDSLFSAAALRAVLLTRYKPDYMSYTSARATSVRADAQPATTRGTRRRALPIHQPPERVQRLFRFRLRSE